MIHRSITVARIPPVMTTVPAVIRPDLHQTLRARQRESVVLLKLHVQTDRSCVVTPFTTPKQSWTFETILAKNIQRTHYRKRWICVLKPVDAALTLEESRGDDRVCTAASPDALLIGCRRSPGEFLDITKEVEHVICKNRFVIAIG